MMLVIGLIRHSSHQKLRLLLTPDMSQAVILDELDPCVGLQGLQYCVSRHAIRGQVPHSRRNSQHGPGPDAHGRHG